MTGYWNAYKLDIPTQRPMAMAMAIMMISSEWKPPSMPPSQDEAHTISGDFTEITLSNSDNDLHWLRVTSARLDSRMPDNSKVENGGWCYFGCSFFLFSLHLSFFGSQPSTNGVGTGFYHLRR